MADWNRKPGFDLTGKTAVVVGVGTPPGPAIAAALAEAGADVGVASATMDGEEVMAAKRAAKAVESLGRRALSHGWDVTLPTNVQVGMRQMSRDLGAPNILVYNADAQLAKPIERVGDAEFAHLQAVNQSGAFYAARSFVREAEDGAANRILFVTGIHGERGVENLTAYATAKAGVSGLMKALSQELGARNTTVNCISTGWMDWTPGRGPEELGQNLLMRFVPMRRFGRGDELGALAVLLASEAAGYINGQTIHVDGGAMTHL
ncbi:MAG: SDR family NAD(P)-dependent oxidoreductase [Dehalococcoidia bacterium]